MNQDRVSINYDIYRSVVAENQRLRDELQMEKAAHIETKARIVFANHILYGNRDEKVNLFKSEYENVIEDLKNKINKLENYFNF